MEEILLVFLFLTQLLCPETKTDSLLSGRGHLQHAGSFPGEKKSVETKYIEDLFLYITQSWNRSGEAAGRQSLFLKELPVYTDVYLPNLLLLMVKYCFSLF